MNTTQPNGKPSPIPALKYARGVFLFLYNLYTTTHDRMTVRIYTLLYDLLQKRAEATITATATATATAVTSKEYQQQIDEYITYATDKLEDFIYRFTPKVLFLVGSYMVFYLLIWFMGVSFSAGLTTTLQSIHNTSYEFLTLVLHIVFTIGLVLQLLTASILFFSTVSVVIHHIVGDIVSYTLTITTKVNVETNTTVSGGVNDGVNDGVSDRVTNSIIEVLANTFTLTTNSTPQLIVGYQNSNSSSSSNTSTNNQWVSISWKENNGLLVAGQSGSGKSQTAAFYLIQYALQGVKLILCDYDSPDGDEETLSERVSFLQESFYLPPAKTTEEIVARLRSLSKEYELRKKDPTRRFPLLFVIDEVSAFFQSLDDGDYGYSPSSFARELLLFRKVGIRAMIIGQEWSSNFSKSAREALRPIRSAFRVKILHKIDGANAKMLLDASDQKSARVLSEMKTGQIYYNKEILNIPLLTKEDAKYSSERLHSTILYNEKIYQDRIYQASTTPSLTPSLTPTPNPTPTKTSGGEEVLLNSLLNIQE